MPFTAPESDLEQPKGFTAPESDVAAPPAASTQEVQPMDPAMLRAAAIAGGGQFVGSYPISGPAAVRMGVTGTRLALEGGGTALGQALALPTGPVGMAATGAAAAKFTNALGQGIEYAVYGTPYSAKENDQAGLMGAVPIAGVEQRIASVSESGLRNALMFGGKLGAAGAATEAVTKPIYEGEAATPGELAAASALPFAIGSAGEWLSSRGSHYVDRAAEFINNLMGLKKAGVMEPTPGMTQPARFARLEAAQMKEEPTGKVARAVDRAYGDLAQNLNEIVPETMENRTVYDQMVERSKGIQAAKDELDKLGPKVQQSQTEARDALLDLDKSKKDFFEAASRANEKALSDVSEAVLENARKVQLAKVQGATKGIGGADARTAMVETVIKPMDASYDTYWARQYAQFPDKEAIFDTTPIIKEVERIYAQDKKPVPQDLIARLSGAAEDSGVQLFDARGNPIKGGGGENKASLNVLRDLRDTLLKKGKINEADSTIMEGSLRDLGRFITDELDRQASKAFGEEGAAQFKAVQADYKRYSDLWHKRGIELLYAIDPSDSVVTNIVEGIEKNGANADEYKNLRSLVANMAQPGQARLVRMPGIGGLTAPIYADGSNVVNPELAGRLTEHINDLLRSNIFYRSSDAAGVVPSKLIATLNQIGRDPEALRMLGFGTPQEVTQLAKLFRDNPRASSMTGEQMSHAYQSLSLRGGDRISISELLANPMRVSDIENNLLKATIEEGLGKIDSAQKRVNEAVAKATEMGIGADKIERRLTELRSNPIYAFFEKRGPITEQGFNSMVDALFSPKANAYTNRDIESIFKALRASTDPQDKALMRNLQRAYIQNHLINYQQVGTKSSAGTRINVSALTGALQEPGRIAPKSELERMTLVLEPEQQNAVLESLRAAARQLRPYEQIISGEQAARKGPKWLMKGMDAVGDMLNKGQYAQAIEGMMNPKEYANSLAVKGEWLKTAGEPMKAVAPQVTRFLPQMQQVPAFINQFAMPQPQPSR